MNPQEIEFGKLGGIKITMKSVQLSNGEMRKHPTSEDIQRAQEARSEIIASGEWWHPWEQDPRLLAMAEAYGFSPDDFNAALSVLKQHFGAPWLQENANTRHPLLPSLLEPKSQPFHRFGLKALHLGYAISQFGLSRLSSQVKAELLKPRGFESFAFEIEVLAWLKSEFPNLCLEHELGLTTAKPDAKLRDGLYVEIRNLQTSEIDKTMQEKLNKLGHRLGDLVDKGAWEWHIDLGLPRNLWELENAYKSALAVIKRAKPPFDDTEGNVHIQMVEVAEDAPRGKIIVGNFTNFPPLELLELDRMVRHLVHKKKGAARKLKALPTGSSLIVYFRPTVPTLNLMLLASGAMGEDMRKKLSEGLFGFAIGKDSRVKAIPRVYIEVWRALPGSEAKFRKGYKTNPFVFFNVENLFFSPS
jgi:hypothetical protein